MQKKNNYRQSTHSYTFENTKEKKYKKNNTRNSIGANYSMYYPRLNFFSCLKHEYFKKILPKNEIILKLNYHNINNET